MRMASLFMVRAFCLITLPFGAANAWESSYSSQVSEPLRQLTQDADGNPITEITAGSFEERQFGRVIQKYPIDQVELGEGWDLYLGKKTNSVCVSFDVDGTKAQSANLTLRQVSDEETRDVTLNLDFQTSGGGGTKFFKGKGKTTLHDTSLERFHSKDILLIAHASVNTETKFTIPPATDALANKEYRAIRLLSDLNDLRSKKRDQFRKYCGDGYVSSIVSGADLYSLLTFHSVSQSVRSQINAAMETSGDYSTVYFPSQGDFSLSGSLEKIIQDNLKSTQLSIKFLQEGGEIKTLPTSLNALQKKIEAMPVEAWTGPKPIYIIVTPYSELPDLDPLQNDDEYTLTLQAALRYSRRLDSMHAEILDMLVDFQRDKTADSSPDLYYFSYNHGLRREDLQLIREGVEDEIVRTGKIIELLERCPKICDSDTIVDVNKAIQPKKVQKDAFGLNKNDFDDLRWWIQLPVPINAIPPQILTQIQDQKLDLGQRRALYAKYLYNHWIKRQDDSRCSLYSECLTRTQQQSYYSLIFASLSTDPAPRSLIEVLKPDDKLPNMRTLVIPKCADILVSNSARDGTRGQFNVEVETGNGSGTFQPEIRAQDMYFSANHRIAAADFDRKMKVTGQNLFAGVHSTGVGTGFSGYVEPEMKADVHFNGLLETDVTFDAGPYGNSGIYFVAVPQSSPAAACAAFGDTIDMSLILPRAAR